MLFNVRGLLSNVCWLLFGVLLVMFCVSCGVGWLLFVVCCLRCVDCCLLFVVCCLVFAV